MSHQHHYLQQTSSSPYSPAATTCLRPLSCDSTKRSVPCGTPKVISYTIGTVLQLLFTVIYFISSTANLSKVVSVVFLFLNCFIMPSLGTSIKVDWNKDNVLFKDFHPHLVRVHMGDRLEITCSQRYSVLYITQDFQEFSSCQIPQNKKPFWSYNCSHLYDDPSLNYFGHRTILALYAQSADLDSPRFKYGQAYFLIDVGYEPDERFSDSETEPTPKPVPSSSPKEAIAQKLVSNNSFLESEEEEKSEETEEEVVMKTREETSLEASPSQLSQNVHDPYLQNLMQNQERSSDDDEMLMDSSEVKTTPRVNLCNQYNMKLPFFVEFRDDEIDPTNHLHMSIVEEIEDENHLRPPGSMKYSHSFTYRLESEIDSSNNRKGNVKTDSLSDLPNLKFKLVRPGEQRAPMKNIEIPAYQQKTSNSPDQRTTATRESASTSQSSQAGHPDQIGTASHSSGRNAKLDPSLHTIIFIMFLSSVFRQLVLVSGR